MPCTVLVAARAGPRPPLISHSFDTSGGVDFRLVRVPPDANPPSPRPIHSWDERAVPRFFGVGRGPIPAYATWDDGYPAKTPEVIGTIPQVDKTFGYWEAASGIANDCGVMIAESTCSAVFGAKLRGEAGGKALLSYQELTRIALERCSGAKEAVELMGSLAVEHGFAGNTDELGGAAESLSVVDGEEAWVFHVMPDDSGTSAIWAAQRVADGHAAVVPNIFVIRTIDDDSDDFLVSATARTVAERCGLWRPGTPFDFAAVFSANEARPFYCGRRQWRALSLLAPSLDLNPEYGDLLNDTPYPFSVAPDAPLTAATFCTIMRDTYAGTPFDMARNPASGPFGTTDWFDSGLPNVIADDEDAAPASPEAAAKRDLIAAAKEAEAATCDPANPTKPSSRRGAIEFDERPIGVFRMAYSYVGEASPSVRGGGGVRPAVLHWAPHASTTAVYFPVPVAMRDCPPPLAAGSVRAIDRTSAFWAFRIAKQTARGLPWSACLEKIAARQAAWEGRAEAMIEALRTWDEAAVPRFFDTSEVAIHELARSVVDDWGVLLDELLLRYGDGWEHEWGEDGERKCKAVEYPTEWLARRGFDVPGVEMD